MMSGIYLLASILCLAFGSSLGDILEGNYNVTEVCTLVKVGTQLGSIASCDYYYVCTKNGPVLAYCQAGYSYDYRTQTCSPSNQVKCYYGVEAPCADVEGEAWVPVANTCNQWIYCKNGVSSGRGSCGTLTFSAQLQQCVYGNCNILSENGGLSLNNICDVVPPKMYFGDPTACKKYQYCFEDGSLANGTCTTSAFVVSTGSCGYDVNGACDRIQPGATPSDCDATSEVQIPDPKVCGNYLYCNGNSYEQKSCLSGQYFDINSKTCVSRQSAVTVSTCNRCQYATKPFVNALTNDNCNTYYYCNKGVNGDISTCPDGYFFNELQQGCAPNSDLTIYGTNYGACADATPATTTTVSTSPTTSTTTPTTTTTVG